MREEQGEIKLSRWADLGEREENKKKKEDFFDWKREGFRGLKAIVFIVSFGGGGGGYSKKTLGGAMLLM